MHTNESDGIEQQCRWKDENENEPRRKRKANKKKICHRQNQSNVLSSNSKAFDCNSIEIAMFSGAQVTCF